jgi:hypothetical protein
MEEPLRCSVSSKTSKQLSAGREIAERLSEPWWQVREGIQTAGIQSEK